MSIHLCNIIYNNKQEYNEHYETIANYVINNYGKLIESEKKEIIKMFISNNEVDDILLKCLIKYYNPEKHIMNLETFISQCKKILKIFKRVFFDLEDDEWNIYKFPNNRFEIKENEVIFENTIPLNYVSDSFKEYIEHLIRILNNVSDYKVDYKLLSDEENHVCFVLLFIRK